jgi:glycosyltransferase involved in cell wall biosynthesis
MGESKRICILSGIYPPDVGGPAKFIKEMSEFSALLGYEIINLSYTNSASQKLQGCGVKTILISRKLWLPFRYIQLIRQILFHADGNTVFIANGCFLEIYLASYFRSLQYVAKIPGDIVWERARVLGKTKFGIEDFQNSKLSIRIWVFRKMNTLAIQKAVSVIVPSTGLQKIVEGWGVPHQRIKLIYNSVNLDQFEVAFDHEKRYDVVTVCRLVPWKGVAELIDACASLQLNLLVIGDGPDRAKLGRIEYARKGYVEFTGDLDLTEVISYLYQSKVFVLNSEFEATSYAMIEAKACGLPVIGRARTGSEEVVREAIDGFIINSQKELTERLSLMFSEDFPMEEFQIAAKEDVRLRFNQFVNFSSIIDSVVSTYE